MIGKLITLAILGGFAAFVTNTLLSLDVNKRVYNHLPGPCHKVKGVESGSEDIVVVGSLAFITSGLYYMSPRAKHVTGKIFLFDFEHPNKEAKELKINGNLDRSQFFPHGMSYIEKNGSIRLYVISHSSPLFLHSVEVFDFDSKTQELHHVKTIRDEKFVRPNDLTVVGEDAFILSNDGAAQTVFTNVLEIFFGIAAGSIVYYDGQNSHWLMERATSPNGILVNPQKTHLFVSHINTETIGIYKLAKDYKSLEPVTSVPLLTASDNFFFDVKGQLWTGAHPVLKDAMGHLGKCDDLSLHAPSQVLRLKFSKDFTSWEVNEVLADDGRMVSASSIAVVYNDQLLVGTVCRELLYCKIAHPTVAGN